MSDLMKLELVDKDGAIREAEEAVAGDSRADFFRKAALGGAAALGGGVLLTGFPSIAQGQTPSRRKSKRNDVAIANYALTLEYLENEFYKEALRTAGLSGEILATARIVQAHENTHVATLRRLLGRSAVRRPSFEFSDTTANQANFLKTAVVLEDTGVAAYAGQGPNILQRSIVTAALSIHSVEARHAALLRRLNNSRGGGAPRAFDKALSAGSVLKAVKPFIK